MDTSPSLGGSGAEANQKQRQNNMSFDHFPKWNINKTYGFSDRRRGIRRNSTCRLLIECWPIWRPVFHECAPSQRPEKSYTTLNRRDRVANPRGDPLRNKTCQDIFLGLTNEFKRKYGILNFTWGWFGGRLPKSAPRAERWEFLANSSLCGRSLADSHCKTAGSRSTFRT